MFKRLVIILYLPLCLSLGCNSVRVTSDPPGAVVYSGNIVWPSPLYGIFPCPTPMRKRGVTPCSFSVSSIDFLTRTRVIWPDGTKGRLEWYSPLTGSITTWDSMQGRQCMWLPWLTPDGNTYHFTHPSRIKNFSDFSTQPTISNEITSTSSGNAADIKTKKSPQDFPHMRSVSPVPAPQAQIQPPVSGDIQGQHNSTHTPFKSNDSIADKLRQLKQLRDEDLITEDEFEILRKSYLDAL